jgi:hypothetical protein
VGLSNDPDLCNWHSGHRVLLSSCPELNAAKVEQRAEFRSRFYGLSVFNGACKANTPQPLARTSNIDSAVVEAIAHT